MEFPFAFIIIQYLCLLFSLSVHEAAHAKTADACGDPSAQLLGRVSLNPVVHADPIGTVVMPLIMMVFQFPFLFGWAKPVPFNPVNLKNIRRDPVLIAIAGPASNIAIAVVATVLLRIALTITGGDLSPEVGTVVFYLVMINLVLFFFNLIPVPPLDGHHVLYYFLPPDGQKMLEQIGPFGIIIAIVVARPLFGIVLPPLQGLFLWFTGL